MYEWKTFPVEAAHAGLIAPAMDQTLNQAVKEGWEVFEIMKADALKGQNGRLVFAFAVCRRSKQGAAGSPSGAAGAGAHPAFSVTPPSR